MINRHINKKIVYINSLNFSSIPDSKIFIIGSDNEKNEQIPNKSTTRTVVLEICWTKYICVCVFIFLGQTFNII